MPTWLSSILASFTIPTWLISAVLGFVGAVIGGRLSAKATQNVFQKEKENKEQFAATILFYDLQSIERYLKEGDTSVIIRYSEKWQSLAADCSFLTGKDVEWVYKFYDAIFDYNYRYFTQNEASEITRTVGSFTIKERGMGGGVLQSERRYARRNLLKMMFDLSDEENPKPTADYKSLIDHLQEKAKK